MNIELVIFDMAGTTVNDDDGVNRSVRAAPGRRRHHGHARGRQRSDGHSQADRADGI